MRKEHRICALCRHLEVVASGQEFPGIADTEFMVFRCRVFGWSTREDYLMESEAEKSFARQEAFDCPRWEECLPQ